MAKIIKYKFLSAEINHGTEENPAIEQIFLDKAMDWNEANEEVAKREAHNGEYIIEDDGIEIIEKPSQLDRIESQVAYLAMMTGNEDILEV